MWRNSLKLRLGIGMAVMLVITVAVLTFSAYDEFHEALFALVDSSLYSQTNAVTTIIDSAATISEVREEIPSIFGKITGARSPVYRIWFEGESIDFDLGSHERWPLDWSPPRGQAPAPGKHKFFNVPREDRPYRLLWARYNTSWDDIFPAPVLNIIVAHDYGDLSGESEDFVKLSLIVGGTVFLGAIILTFGILGWGLKPVTQITRKMNDITGKNLTEFSPFTPKSPAEFEPFVKSWDRMIERLARAMKQQRRFTADASHELRTPLAVAKSTLQAARSQPRSPEDYKAALDQSLDDLARLEHLTEQLLTLAHLDDIGDLSDQEEINLKDLISEVCEQHVPLANRHKTHLTWQLEEASIKGDAEQIKRMLGNLIENAIKHGPAGGEIIVSLSSADESVKISVHDEGGNIPPEEIKLIFDRFYRIQKARDRTSGGSGLGLAIAREIARKHQGQITLTSHPQSGTEFEITLPHPKYK